jgi:hypothetical protein
MQEIKRNAIKAEKIRQPSGRLNSKQMGDLLPNVSSIVDHSTTTTKAVNFCTYFLTVMH